MHGHGDDVVTAHRGSSATLAGGGARVRERREEAERALLDPHATFSVGAGNRAREEEPDPFRTCFERDRDRIVHSAAFRRLAGKTQVVVFPNDHQRTRLTHAIEVAQCAVAMARGVGVNVTLADAMALGHDCGHGPGGHASEDAFDEFIPGGYDHGPWGADVVLADLNLCAETLDGIRNHSWSRPAPSTIEGEIVSWADRIAYCAHDLEDAIHAGIVSESDIPPVVREVAGTTRREQLSTFINAVIATTSETGVVGMDKESGEALGELRRFNYERIYTRPESVLQSQTVVRVLRGLVEYYLQHPGALPDGYRTEDAVRGVVTYVGGMTDRFAFKKAQKLLGWDPAQLPRGIGRGA
ncbi:HD domain-containing protein [Tessaracoccus sp. OS52]|uniref:HD domain-containing protein n=1 Tax=Tessaracoccus sp. OS52 TaxID=2886691 RepID=UPI001D10D75B|nr:HD domain-containing protein [Tessaracoccus sp. OS52]MCC2592713.1 HD domain-containing protein [Tessaracoccus sp. OS52]